MITGVLWYDRVHSTQDEAHRMAAEGAAHGTAVAARIQTSGRGMRGRSWDSGEGGLWLSVVARPVVLTAVEVIGIRVGLALAALLEGVPGVRERIQIKWPNDLYVRHGKLGGILVEGRWQGEGLNWMVIGVGINVRNRIMTPIEEVAIGLSDLGADPVLEQLAQAVADAVAAASLREGPLTEQELTDFAGRDRLRGLELSGPVAGRAEGISPAGRLLIRRTDGRLVETVESVTLPGSAR